MALPVATGMMLILSILVVGFFTVSLRVNDTSVADRSSKRALAAAEAGLQTAVYRLNSLNGSAQANAGMCLRAGWEAPVAGVCAGMTEPLGNGAQYTYWVTPAGSAGACVTLPSAQTSTSDRCITSIGTVNGVSRRIQTRVVQQPTVTVPDFNNVGLVGKSLVYAWNSVNLTSDVGSNSEVRFDNSVNVYDDDSIGVDGKVILLTGGTMPPGNSVNVDGGPPQYVTTPFELPVPPLEGPENANDNAALPNSVFEGGAAGRHLRRFEISSGEYTMPPGTYHFCNVKLGNGVKWKFSHTLGQRTRIYVDSPSRPGSESCAGQPDPAGTFGADNSVEINKESGEREELLNIYMYGTPQNDTRDRYPWCTDLNGSGLPGECRSDFMLDNSVSFYGGVYAPNSTVQAHNSVSITGSIAADKIRFYNSINFTLTGPMIGQPPETSGAGAAERKGWTECRPATNPQSAC